MTKGWHCSWCDAADLKHLVRRGEAKFLQAYDLFLQRARIREQRGPGRTAKQYSAVLLPNSIRNNKAFAPMVLGKPA